MNAGKKVIKKESSAVPVAKKAMPVSKVTAPVAQATSSKVAAVKAAVPAAKPTVPQTASDTSVAKPRKPAVKAAVTPVKSEPRQAVNVTAQKVAAAKGAASTAKKSASAAKAESSQTDAHSFSPEYLVLMQKDPNWMHAFWDVSERRVNEAVKGGGKLVLRLYDVSSDMTVRVNKQRVFRDIDIPSDARSWYIQNQGQGGAMNVVLGTVTSSGRFEPIVNSDHVQTFGAEGQFISGSDDDLFLRASLGGVPLNGFGSSGQMLPGVSSGSFLFAPSSEAFSSMSFSSQAFSSAALLEKGSSDIVNKGKDFFLWVKTRLIVYGGTRPDAHLQVRGQPFPLNPDGTFSLEMDLPDSTQIIPVFATDHEGDFPTTIVPIVVKRTE